MSARSASVMCSIVLISSLAQAQISVVGDSAADFKRSSLTAAANRARLKFAPSPDLPPLVDPRCAASGSSWLQLSSSTQIGTPVTLSCANWFVTPRGFRYAGGAHPNGGVRKIIYERNRLQITLRGEQYAAIAGPIAFAEITFQAGSTRYCARLESFTHNGTTRIIARGSSLPCAGAPTPTPVPTNALVLPTSTRTNTPVAATSTATRTPTASIPPPTPTATASATPGTAGNPTLVGFVPGVGVGYDVAVMNGLAFVAADPFGLSIADVSKSAAPEVVSSAMPPFIGQAIAVAGTRAVVAGIMPDGVSHLWVVDVSDTLHPAVIGELSTTIPYIAGQTGFQDVVLDGSGTLAVAAVGTAGVWVVSLADPTAPSVIGTYNTPGTAYAAALNATATLAYVADGSAGVKILSLPNPSVCRTSCNPTLAGSLSMAGTQTDISVVGTYAYLTDRSGLLNVVDVGTPAAPALRGAALLLGFGLHVSAEGTQVAVISSTSLVNYLEIFNVANPAAPTRTGSAQVGAVGTARGVDLVNGLAYVAASSDGLQIYDLNGTVQGGAEDDSTASALATKGALTVVVGQNNRTNTAVLDVLDTSNATAPDVIGQLSSAAAPTFTGVALNGAGSMAVATLGTAGVWVVNLGNPAAPSLLGTYDTPGTAYAVALNATATLAYVADGSGGLKVLNLPDPSTCGHSCNPTLAGSLSMSGTQADVAVVGNIAYLADKTGTLNVVDVTNPAAPLLKGAALLSGFGVHLAAQGTLVAVLSTTSLNAYLDVLNVPNPLQPTRVGSVVVGAGVATAKGVALANGVAYVAANDQDLKIYSLATPSNPLLLSTTAIPGNALAVALNGSDVYVANFPGLLSIVNLGG